MLSIQLSKIVFFKDSLISCFLRYSSRFKILLATSIFLTTSLSLIFKNKVYKSSGKLSSEILGTFFKTHSSSLVTSFLGAKKGITLSILEVVISPTIIPLANSPAKSILSLSKY